MVVACWSSKGGSGTTVVAVALARLRSDAHPAGALLVDLVGDAPAVLGVAEPAGPGVSDWLTAGDTVPADGLARIERPVRGRLSLVCHGRSRLDDLTRADVLVAMLAADPRAVVVDCGTIASSREPGPDGRLAQAIASQADESLLVVRPCYLALRRAVSSCVRPSGVVLVDEPERTLDATDVENVLGVPVVATVPHSPGIARAVDAGVLGGRVPQGLRRALRGVT
jgi:hypothetical protein